MTITKNQITVEMIDPERANALLAGNESNRRIRRRRVEHYARQMQNGQWLTTGDPIRLDPNGRLLDGQHRLLAVIEAGVAVQFVVIRDVPTESFKVLDSGMMRGTGDAIGIGVANANKKAAVSRLMFVLDVDGDPRSASDLEIVTRSDVHDYYNANLAEIDAGVASGHRIATKIIGTNQTAWAAMHILAYRVSTEWAEEFVEGVITGAHLGAGDPRLALRNWLTNNRGRDYGRAGWHLAVFVKAWNAWMKGEQRQLMSIRPDEPFPTVVTERRIREES